MDDALFPILISTGRRRGAAEAVYSGAPIGTNLGYIGYAQGSLPFLDLLRGGTNWVNDNSFDDAEVIDVDANGWPNTIGAGQVLQSYLMARDSTGNGIGFTSRPNNNTPGNYMVLRYTGTGTFTVVGGTGFSITTISHDTASTPKRAVFSIAWGTAGNPRFQLTATTVGDHFVASEPTHSLGLGFVAEGDKAALIAGEIFDPLWLSQIMATPGPLRFMDWQRINDSTVVDFADLKTDNWRTDNSYGGWTNSNLYAQPSMARLSTMVALMVATGQDGWFCRHHLMTEAAWTECVEYFRDNVPQGLVMNYEDTNEWWNGQFDQSVYYSAQGAILYPAENSQRQNRFYGADMSKRMLELIDTAYGSGNRARWHGWVCGQAGSTNQDLNLFPHDGLGDYMVTLGNCSYGVAPYAGGRLGAQNQRRTGPADSGFTKVTADMTVAEILDHLEGICFEGNSNAAKERAVIHAGYAVSIGIGFGFYECGQHMSSLNDDDPVEANLVLANSDPRMEEITEAYIYGIAEAVRAVTGEYPVFAYYSSHSGWQGQTGCWGAYRDQYQTPSTAYKALGVINYIAAHTS